MVFRVLTIARITYLEAFRQRFFHLLFILSLALVISSLFFQQFNFGSTELKFIVDLGFGSVVFFGTVVAIVLSAQLLFAEFENRTVLTILARPMPRHHFLLGKYLGMLGLLLSFVVSLSAVTGVLLVNRHMALLEAMPSYFERGVRVRYGDIPILGAVHFLKLGIVASMTFLVATFSRTNLYTVVVSFLVVLIAQLQYLGAESYGEGSPFLLRVASWAISVIFPNFQVFNVGDLLVYSEAGTFPVLNLLVLFGYGAVYLVLYLLLAAGFFRFREI